MSIDSPEYRCCGSAVHVGHLKSCPTDFAVKMSKALWNRDIEAAHSDADKLMCDLLRYLGYEEAVEIFEKADK